MNELDELRAELAEVEAMSDAEVCEAFNADSKAEYVGILLWEISRLEAEDVEFDYTEMELEAERSALCESQGLARWC